MSAPVLAAERLAAGYDRQPVVRDIDLEVRPGEVVALLGANGVGKSTTLLALAGALPLLAGDVLLHGRAIRSGVAARTRAGLGLITEERSVFARLSVADNLRLGQGPPERALELFPELRDHLHRRAGLLSGGQQQMLTLGRALAARPAVLLVDELSLGLAPLVVARLLDAVRAAADAGVAIVLVEQHASRALAVADYALVLQRGRCVLRGTATDLRDRFHEIERSYLARRPDGASITKEIPTP